MRHAILKLLVCICYISLFFCHGGRINSESQERDQKNQRDSHRPRSGFRPEGENGFMSPRSFRPQMENGLMHNNGRKEENFNQLKESEIRPDMITGKGHKNHESRFQHKARSGRRPEGRSGFRPQNVKSHFKDESRFSHTKDYTRDGRDFKSASRSEEFQSSRHRRHRKGVLKSAKRIFLAIMFVSFVIVLLIGLVYVGVKFVNKFLRWYEKRRLNREQRRMRRINHVNSCHCNCASHSQGPHSPGNYHNTSTSIAQPIVNNSSMESVNNVNSLNNHQDYEIVNVNSNSSREINNIRPEVTYPKLDQVNSTHNDFYRRPINNSNHSSRPAAENKNAPQINMPLLK
jgi:hypothetical protein